jgi:hypothetical protein
MQGMPRGVPDEAICTWFPGDDGHLRVQDSGSSHTPGPYLRHAISVAAGLTAACMYSGCADWLATNPVPGRRSSRQVGTIARSAQSAFPVKAVHDA